MSTGQSLKDACEKTLFIETENKAHGHELYFLRGAQVKMAGDFLFASITDRACRMFFNFDKVVKLYLGVPVTPDRCFRAKCMGAKVHRFGAHSTHYTSTTTYRHNEVRDLLARELRLAQRSVKYAMDVHVEPALEEHGVRMKDNAVDRSRARADVLIFLPDTGATFWVDVTVSQPRPEFRSTKGRSEIDEAEKMKFDRYLKNFEINKAQIIPLVFTYTGGWSDGTVDFIKMIFAKGGETE